MASNLIYKVDSKPSFSKLIPFAFQQLLAIMAATIAVPMIIGNGMSTSAALFGAGIGTIIYLLFTKFKSPVFLGSSFAFLGSMGAAFGGAASISIGYLGLIIGAVFAGLVYVVIAIIVKFVGADWVKKIMPSVVIGPTVSIIGLSLAGGAIADLLGGNGGHGSQTLAAGVMDTKSWMCLICGLVTLAVTMLCSVYGKKMFKMIPFIIGIFAGYITALIITLIGNANGNEALMIINFDSFRALAADGVTIKTFFSLPDFTFIKAFNGIQSITPSFIASIAVAYIPVAFVVFAEHIADHKNISYIIDTDLLEEPGLHRTLLGDGIGSMAGAFFGGCPNTTYGESIGCVAISGNASVITIFTTAILALIIAFVSPFIAFLSSIPACVMGGVCISLYGFISVSGLKMLQPVNLNNNRNLFVVSVILIAGIGGLAIGIPFGDSVIKITSIACALILGILTNVLLSGKKDEDAE